MKRFLVILMLFLMPLQTAWGSVNSYCQHEESASADHFGHHQHEHVDAGSDADADDGGIGRTVDADCDYCHHAGSNLMALAAPIDHVPCRLAPHAFAEPHYLSFIADVTHPPDI